MVFVPTLCHKTLYQNALFNREFFAELGEISYSYKPSAKNSHRVKTKLVLAPHHHLRLFKATGKV